MSAHKITVDDFVICHTDGGHIVTDGDGIEKRKTHFYTESVGVVRKTNADESVVYVIGAKHNYRLPNSVLEPFDPTKTGKNYPMKICNICHVIKEHSEFEPNQRDAQGATTTRPSCRICRRDIDKKGMTKAAIKEAEKFKPKKGTLWQCPICRKQSIVGVTAKVVLDHRHSDGARREFICDSCNTGLGRFKNGEDYLKNALEYVRSFEK